ncbi:hypothetical protein MK489_20255 [Myxococcota bacterium]|nr:hypothetical protein [Myxococcota bacterium]
MGWIQLWALWWFTAWLGASGWLVRHHLAPAWGPLERFALSYALASSALVTTTLVFAHTGGLGFYGAGSLSALVASFGWGWGVRGRRTERGGNGAPTAPPRTPSTLGLLVLGSVPVSLIAGTNFSGDWSAHYWNVQAIQDGWLPLPYPTDPALQVPYHYAIDLLAAVWGSVLPVDREWVFDGLSLAAWNVSALLGARLLMAVRPMDLPRAVGYVVAFGLLGGGMGWLFYPLVDHPAAKGIEAAGLSAWLYAAGGWGPPILVGREIVNFPTVHYFFNMPFAAGLPMALAALCLYIDWSEDRRKVLVLAVGALLAGLSSSHLALFALLIATMSLTGLAHSVGGGLRTLDGWRRSLLPGTVVIVGGACALARLQGGVFGAPDGIIGEGRIALGEGLKIQTAALPLYLAVGFGVPGLLGLVAGIRSTARGSFAGMLLFLLALIGVLVPHLVWYRVAPIDNFKFLTVSSLALGILSGAAAQGLWDRLPRPMGTAALVLLIAASVATPLLHVAARMESAPDYTLAIRGGGRGDWPRLQPLFRDRWQAEADAARWLRQHMGRTDRLLTLPQADRAASVTLALSGRFSARPQYDGYPGIALEPSRVARARAWLGRVVLMDSAALCQGAPLWIYVREAQLREPMLLSLGRAARSGLLDRVYHREEVGGRHVIYRACPTESGSSSPAASG